MSACRLCERECYCIKNDKIAEETHGDPYVCCRCVILRQGAEDALGSEEWHYSMSPYRIAASKWPWACQKCGMEGSWVIRQMEQHSGYRANICVSCHDKFRDAVRLFFYKTE